MSVTKKPYCYAPFVHMYVHDSESNRLCCVSKESNIVKKTTSFNFEERWTEDYYKKYREKFLEDGLEENPPSVCDRCTENETAGILSDRLMFEQFYKDKNIELNIEKGNSFGSPIDIDLRASNLCNLKCRMCSPWSSSQLDKEVKNNKVLSFLDEFKAPERDKWDTDENLNFLFSNIEHGERVKLLGGEPTIMPEVNSILDYLIDNELFDAPLYITTNLTNNRVSFIEKISKLKNVRFNYSIDGTGSVVEYIRNPLDWDTTVENMKVYGPLSKYRIINYTLQAYNILSLGDFLHWVNEYNSNTEYKVYPRIEVLTQPEWASYRSIPKNIRDYYLKNLLKDDIINTDISSELGTVLPVINRCLNDTVEYPKKPLAVVTKRYDVARKQHIKNYIPEVWEVIKGEYDAIQL